MSRHRNIRNLTEDDYYDDYDDDYYDDDYYDDYYKEEAPKPKPKPVVAKKKTTVTPKKKATTTKAPVATTSSAKKSTGVEAGNIGGISIDSGSISNAKKSQTSESSSNNNNKGMENNSNKEEARKKRLERKKELKERLTKMERRPKLSMVILGHVDAGKSTLVGQLLLQLGQVNARTVSKYQKQASELGKASFALAWVMDEDEIERERGVTIDIGTKTVSTDTYDWTLLDAPGHADYVPAMITGAASADVGLLVVDSCDGEFESGWRGQTKEHVILARGLGVSQFIIGINKLDAYSTPWSKQRFLEIKSVLTPFFQQQGYNDPSKLHFVPLSGLTGINIHSKNNTQQSLPAELKSWYQNGPSLTQVMDKLETKKNHAKLTWEKPLRFIISDVYADGKGIVVKGRVAQGILCAGGEQLMVLPIGDIATVQKILSTSESYALAGDTIDVFLTGIMDVARISPGNILVEQYQDVVTDNNNPTSEQLSVSPRKLLLHKRIKAKLVIMEELAIPIIRGAQVLFHMHCLDVPAVVSKLISSQKINSNKMNDNNSRPPRVLTGGCQAIVELKLQEKICLEPYSDCRSIGRFVLRRGGNTIALGDRKSVV